MKSLNLRNILFEQLSEQEQDNGIEKFTDIILPEDKKVVLYKEELAGAGNRTSANDEVKQYLTNQKTDSGEKLELPQELIDIASQAEKDGIDDDSMAPESEEQKEE